MRQQEYDAFNSAQDDLTNGSTIEEIRQRYGAALPDRKLHILEKAARSYREWEPAVDGPVTEQLRADIANYQRDAEASAPDSAGTISLDQPSKGAIPMIPPPEAARPGSYRSNVPGMAPAMPFPDLAKLPEPPPGVLNDPILRGYTEDDFRAAVISQSPIFAEASMFGKGSDELGKESLNRAWAVREIGPEASDAEYRLWRSRKAKQYLGKDDANEQEIFDLGRNISGEIQAKAKGIQQIYGLSVSQGLDDVLANQHTPMTHVFGNWKTRNQALIGQGNDADYLAGAYQTAQRAQADLEPVKDTAAHAWAGIRQLAQGKATPYDMMKLGRELAARTPEDRKGIYRLLVAAADANRIDRSVFDQIAQNIGKSISQSFDFLDKGGLQSMESSANLWLTEIGRGNVQMGDNGVPRFAYNGQPNTRALTAQEKSDLEVKFKADLGSYQVIRELMALRRRSIDPVVPVAPDGTWGRTAETGLYGLAGSTGPTLVIAGGSLVDPLVGFALGAEVIATDKYDDYLLEGVEPGAARRLSLVTGAVESAVNLFDLRILAGHAPGFARLLKGVEPGLKKWSLTTGMSVASANIAQGTGDLATRFIEELGTTGEVNSERFKAIVGDWAKERPEAFFQLLPAALVGGGIANFRDFKDGGRFLLTPSFLKIVGFSSEQQRRLMAVHTPEEAQAIYREEFSQRTPENIAAGVEQLHAAALAPADGQTSKATERATGDLAKTRDGRTLSLDSFRPLKDRIAEDMPSVVDDYLKNHATLGKTKALVINPDLVRDMDPAYRRDPLGQASNVHQDAVAVANAAYVKALKVASPGEVVFLAGAPGAGKSISISPTTKAAIIVDRTLANLEDAKRQIQEALDSGRAVNIRYMHRPFEETVLGTLKRALGESSNGKIGRPVNVNDIAYIYRYSRLNVLQLKNSFRDRISVWFREFNNGNPEKVDQKYVENLPDLDEDLLETRARSIAEKWFSEHEHDNRVTSDFRKAVLGKRDR